MPISSNSKLSFFLYNQALPYVPNKTWTKTNKCMIKERPDDLWEKHYVRREKNDSKGYQSAIGEMYKALGDEVVLNTCDLVLKTMSKCLDPEVKYLSFPFSENPFFLFIDL